MSDVSDLRERILTLLKADQVASVRPPDSDALVKTPEEMERYNAWWDRDSNFADAARKLLPGVLKILWQLEREEIDRV